MLKSFSLFSSLVSVLAFIILLFGASETSQKQMHSQPSRINRKPGILAPPSDVPSGENAHLYL